MLRGSENSLNRTDFKNEVYSLSNQYMDNLVEKLKKDNEFNNSLKELNAKPHSEQGQFAINPPNMGALAALTKNSKTKAALKIAQKVAKAMQHYRDKRLEEKREAHRQIVISHLKNHINSVRPSYFDTVKEGLAYEVFLSKASHIFLQPQDRPTLDAVRSEARLRTEVRRQEYLVEGIEMLKDYYHEMNNWNNVLTQNQRQLIRGQEQFTQWMDKTDQRIKKDAEQERNIKNHLSKLSIQTNSQLNRLLTNNEEIRQELLIVTQHITDIVEERKQQENRQGLLSAAGFVHALGQFTGNRDLCRIGVIAEAGIQIKTCLTALQGPLSLASLHPIAGIGMAVLSVAGLFSKNKSDSNQLVLKAMQQIIAQLNTIRQ
ncbi:MAG: hypothetical protein JO131_03520, partial [Gammaproteobacteria bacterium]|nr:hypothetical protein [Gammaproteobacteria bacterium]